MDKYALLLDARPSMRTMDSNGYMHVAITPISKACVNPYYGKEIAGSEAHGFDPNKIYYGLRDPKELAKAAKTFDGMPLLLLHHKTDAENPAKEHIVGSVGTDGTFEAPYLKNSLCVTDAKAIKSIENGEAQEISCAYRFKPDFTAGEYIAEDGSKIHYDFIMRDIEGNHVALVPEGRAGHDVKVADSQIELNNKATEERRNIMPIEELVDKIMPNATAEDKAFAIDELKKMGKAEEDEVLEDEDELDEEDYEEDDEDEDIDENPKEKVAFEEGVKYGEKREKAAPKRIAREHESEGGKKAAREEMAKDSIEMIKDELLANFRAINAAAIKVRPLVGEITDPMAFDCAEAIYAFALDHAGVDFEKYDINAYEGMVDMIIAERPSYTVMDSAMAEPVDEMSDVMDALNKID